MTQQDRIHMNRKQYREEQQRQNRDKALKRREAHQQYAERVTAERQADNEAKRQERMDAVREQVTERTRRRHFVTGGTEDEWNERKDELVDAAMAEHAKRAEQRSAAQVRRSISRAL